MPGNIRRQNPTFLRLAGAVAHLDQNAIKTAEGDLN